MVDSLFISMVVKRFGFFLYLYLLLSACAAKAQPPNVVLITLDTTRADRMGFLGSKRGLTPYLDALARQSVIFSRAYAQVPLTTASHTAILTGTFPQYNHVNDFGIPLRADLPYLPDLLHQRGYRTGAFVASLILDPNAGLAPGFDRGFDVYAAGYHVRRNREDRYKSMEKRAGDVVAQAVQWLDKKSNVPFFLWVHLYDPHDPYDPPMPYKTRYATALYDGEIAYTDSAVGQLLTFLRTRGLFDGTLIAVMADHGEGLGEHGEQTHGIFLYDETIHVPLLFKMPAGRSAGKQISNRVSLVDVAPTIMKTIGLEIPSTVQGRALNELMGQSSAGSATLEDRPAYAETDYSHRAFGWSSLRALRMGKYLYVKAPGPELYDQSADPKASRNLAANRKAVSDTMAAQLEEFRRKTATDATTLTSLDPEQAQKLQALGYVASDANRTESNASADSGADPKDKIDIANLLHDAILDVEEGRYQSAIPRLERVLADQPGMSIAQMQLGVAQARLKNYDKAVAPLRKAVELLPESSMGHYELGLALFETGDWKSAAPEFEAAVKRAPKWADAHFSLASVYARINRVPEAITELDTTLGINKDHYRANLLRGRILFLQGHSAEALPNLEKAVVVQPDSREAHSFLADAYSQLGRDADAERERTLAKKLNP
jgi:choline-sulfatase